MPVHELARSAAEQPCLDTATAESVSQLLGLPSRRFFAQRCLIDVGPAIDIAVPLRSDLLRRDFRIHRGEVCEEVPRMSKFALSSRRFHRSAQCFVLRNVDCSRIIIAVQLSVVAPSLDVLVVEDDRALSELLVRSLHAARLTTDAAGDVAEAKRLLSRGSYAVLVLDLMLPDGTGFDVLDFIRAGKLPPLNIIVITAADGSLLVRLDRSMVKTVMFKPIVLDLFIATVRTLASDQSNRPL